MRLEFSEEKEGKGLVIAWLRRGAASLPCWLLDKFLPCIVLVDWKASRLVP